MQNFEKYLESLDESKIVLKRKYTENYPEKNVRQNANIRNTIIEALRDKKLTLSEFNEIVSKHSKSPSKWAKRNERFFKVEEDTITLSRYGNKIANTIQSVNEGRKEITKKHWDKADDDQREEWLLQAFSDSDDALEYVESDWEDLPDEATSNMYESVNEARAPKNWDSRFTMNAIEAYKNGEFDLEDDKSIAEWDKEYNGGRAPKPAFNTKEVVSYAVKTGKKPNGDKMDESVVNESIEDKPYFDFLNALRDSGATNMWGAAPYLQKEFGLSKSEARKVLGKWMKTFESTLIKESTIYTDFSSFVNERYIEESVEINEALKSSKLRNLLSMKKSPKSLLKGIYGQTKIALDKVEDHQIIDVDPKDGPKQNGYVFYYTTQAKENPYASGHYNTEFPANSLLALAKGKKVFYVKSRWSNRRDGSEYSLTTDPNSKRHSSVSDIGPNKSYSGWDASGLGSLSRVISIADAAFVVNPEALETTGNKIMQRSQAKEGAIAFKDDKEFKNANMARYKEILTQRSSTLDVDKEVVKAIEEIADIMKAGIKNKKKDKYNQIIMGTGKDGRDFKINDLSNFTNNLMSDYERWARYTNDAENAKARLEKEGADVREEQWEVKYNEKEALKYAKDIKDRLKKLKNKNLAW